MRIGLFGAAADSFRIATSLDGTKLEQDTIALNCAYAAERRGNIKEAIELYHKLISTEAFSRNGNSASTWLQLQTAMGLARCHLYSKQTSETMK